MNIPVFSLEGTKRGEVVLGKAFSRPVRKDLIRRAVLAETADRQPYGADPLAGKRTSAHYHGRRGIRWAMMNREMARLKRIHGQGFLNYRARFSPQAVKGRRAHPPLVEKVWTKKINKKERRLALQSALAATLTNTSLKETPLVLDNSLEALTKSKELAAVLASFGLIVEEKKRIRAGKGKMRGRKYVKKRGPLLIVGGKKPPKLPGMDVLPVNELRVADVAPGGEPGRLCIWTQSAIEAAGKL